MWTGAAAGTSQFVSQRREPDTVRILSGVFEGRTTGTPIGLLIENTDARARDYERMQATGSAPGMPITATSKNTAFVIIAAAAAPQRARR